ncbi:MAG: Ig-like domain-containing protein, partial [Rikenellaceae bacterium]|nr:Ig-like domain-containing protein [Rikenellaceae bacterium]
MKRILPFIALAAVSVLSMFSCQPEPAEIRVASISLSKSTLELTVGDQASLDATISPDNATNKEISWASDNEAVATVSAEGVVKALRAGTASITATTVDQGKTASCAVTVAEKMGAVTGEATHISCRNAKLSGKVTRSQTRATNLSFGVLYSTSSGVLLGSATKLEAKDFDANYNYTIDTGVLEPETTYYYRSYIIQNEEVEYGETKSFKTLAVSSMIQTLDASGVNHKAATLNAMLDLT